jgi:hypothetical protein
MTTRRAKPTTTPAWCSLPDAGIYAGLPEDARDLIATAMRSFAEDVAPDCGMSIRQSFNAARRLFERGYLRLEVLDQDDGESCFGLMPCFPEWTIRCAPRPSARARSSPASPAGRRRAAQGGES